jgi:ATP-binding cassette subfamily B protein
MRIFEKEGIQPSGGQWQKLAIARAFYRDSEIMILDDATSALDLSTEAALRRSLREELKDTTVIMIAQRIASVQESDLILVMDGGHIVATGKHEDLLQTSQIYREVYESQTKGVE